MSGNKNGILDFFASVRLTIALLIAIALAALLGTVIPQGDAAEALASGMNPTLAALFGVLQLFDVYHSAWFVLLLLLLAANLVICSLRRFPASWRQFRGDPSGVSAVPADLPGDRVIETGHPVDLEAQRLEILLRKRFGKVGRQERADAIVLSGERGGFSRFGVYVVHLGVLLLIAGGLSGAIFGVKGSVEIAEGEATNQLRIRGKEAPIDLPFAIRCDRFTVEHYESGAPKVFRSDLAFIEGGKVVRQGALLVNHPIVHGGFHFYQASYGVVPGGKVTLFYGEGGQKATGRDVAQGESFDLPGSQGRVEVLRIEGNLMQMGPAAKLAIASNRGEVQFWVFQNIDKIKEANPGILQKVPLMNPDLFTPWRFSLRKTGERYFTVLHVARDPGVPLVAGGAFLLIAGLMITFFFSHRRVGIVLKPGEGGGSRIGVTGSCNRNPVGLEGELDRLLREIRQGGARA